ncbi:hypothetical protein Fmac_018369 [Flemingia macrophylla]|uniref:Uncharacterized protein n=1 Tax=Flemingia macrophylla TaxID=520843 RepID=A0ABD1M4R9_9FABA
MSMFHPLSKRDEVDRQILDLDTAVKDGALGGVDSGIVGMAMVGEKLDLEIIIEELDLCEVPSVFICLISLEPMQNLSPFVLAKSLRIWDFTGFLSSTPRFSNSHSPLSSSSVFASSTSSFSRSTSFFHRASSPTCVNLSAPSVRFSLDRSVSPNCSIAVSSQWHPDRPTHTTTSAPPSNHALVAFFREEAEEGNRRWRRVGCCAQVGHAKAETEVATRGGRDNDAQRRRQRLAVTRGAKAGTSGAVVVASRAEAAMLEVEVVSREGGGMLRWRNPEVEAEEPGGGSGWGRRKKVEA